MTLIPQKFGSRSQNRNSTSEPFTCKSDMKSFFSSLSLWSVLKKKPLFTLRNAHHKEGTGTSSSSEENWITAVAALHNTDLLASGMNMNCHTWCKVRLRRKKN